MHHPISHTATASHRGRHIPRVVTIGHSQRPSHQLLSVSVRSEGGGPKDPGIGPRRPIQLEQMAVDHTLFDDIVIYPHGYGQWQCGLYLQHEHWAATKADAGARPRDAEIAFARQLVAEFGWTLANAEEELLGDLEAFARVDGGSNVRPDDPPAAIAVAV